MNDKNKEQKKISNSIEIEDITKLENELNDLIDTNKSIEEKPMKKTSSDMFGGIFSKKEDGENIKSINEIRKDNLGSGLGKSTSNLNETKTSDGYGKFNNIPLNMEKSQEKKQLSKEEELKEKFKYLHKLEELEKKGSSLSKRYNMDSNLDEMIGEYETIVEQKENSNSVNFQAKF